MKISVEHTVFWYFLGVFVLAWGLWIAAGVWFPAYFLPATLLGAWAPTLVAILLIWRRGGKAGVKRFLAGLLRWRVGWHWYAVVLLSVPSLAGLTRIIYAALGGESPQLTYPAGIPPSAPLPLVVVGSFFVGIILGGPLAEDVGWRGFILPELHKRLTAFAAALLVGVVWVIWHLPFFWFEVGGRVIGYVPLPWFALLTIAWSVLFAWVYFNTHSLLLPVLFHASINTTLGLFGILNALPGEPNNSLLAIHTLLTWALVGWIVRRYGRNYLVREKSSEKPIQSLQNQF